MAVPLLIKNLENIQLTGTKDYGFRCLAFSISCVEVTGYATCVYWKSMGVYQSGDGFTVGTSPTTPQPVFFCISQGANSLCDIQPDVLAGDYITITYDVGQQKNIYLPRITSKPTLLWIGSDGSTFYDSALTQLAQSVPTEGFATITNITAPTSAHIGDPISINVTIRNDGGVTDNFFVWITDLDTLSKMVDTVTLAPGQTYTTGLDTTMPNRDLRLKIDAGYVE